MVVVGVVGFDLISVRNKEKEHEHRINAAQNRKIYICKDGRKYRHNNKDFKQFVNCLQLQSQQIICQQEKLNKKLQ